MRKGETTYSLFNAIDDALQGDLVVYLRRQRKKNPPVSHRTIAAELNARHEVTGLSVTVTRQSVWRWCQDNGIK